MSDSENVKPIVQECFKQIHTMWTTDTTRWTQGVIARNANGTPCAAYDDEPHSFCMLGAVEHVTAKHPHIMGFMTNEIYDGIDRWFKKYAGTKPAVSPSISEFNDAEGRTVQDMNDILVDIMEQINHKDFYYNRD